MGKKFVYNRSGLKFETQRPSFAKVVRTVLKYFFVSVVLAIVYYIVFALVFSTDREKELAEQNRLMRDQYESMRSNMRRLDNVLADLEARDGEIYSEIFNSRPPVSGDFGRLDLLRRLDTISDGNIIEISTDKICRAEVLAYDVARRLRYLNSYVETSSRDTLVAVPSHYPFESFSVTQTGASLGRKVNPFYKIMTEHTGIDLLTYAGDKVFATAPGIVSAVVRRNSGLGNHVIVNHGNGYETLYAHLAEINVRRGAHVNAGTQIGVVGVTGMSFAPHLHYEVRRQGEAVDPVHYFFLDQTPREYVKMISISAATTQSLD